MLKCVNKHQIQFRELKEGNPCKVEGSRPPLIGGGGGGSKSEEDNCSTRTWPNYWSSCLDDATLNIHVTIKYCFSWMQLENGIKCQFQDIPQFRVQFVSCSVLLHPSHSLWCRTSLRPRWSSWSWRRLRWAAWRAGCSASRWRRSTRSSSSAPRSSQRGPTMPWTHIVR